MSGLTDRKLFGASTTRQHQCIPLYTMLLALNQTVIDWFSLDVEGSEMEILRGLPFDKVTIKVKVIKLVCYLWSVALCWTKSIYNFVCF